MASDLYKYAKQHGIKYRAAWNRYKQNKIPGAYKDSLGKIRIKQEKFSKKECVAIYCRVSSSKNKNNLETQKQRLVSFCNAKGYSVEYIVCECASGLNDKRPKLIKLLLNDAITKIIVEHDDRLTRFGKNFIHLWMESKGVIIETVNPAIDDKTDLMSDFVSLVTCFTAKLYGQRRTKRKTEELINTLNNK